jgi:cytosine/adenosine deaminase-related metal-dependent hydrolase
MVDLIVSNGLIVTMDRRRRILKEASIAIDDKKIIAIGKERDIKKTYRADVKIDATNHIVMPGFVDGHVHVAQSILRGCGDDIDALAWLKDRIWPLQGQFDEKDGRLSAEFAILGMIKCGTTAFGETLIHTRYGFNGIAEVVEKSGVRAALAKAIMDSATFAGGETFFHPGMHEEKDASIREAVEMIRKWHGKADDRVRVWFGPRPVGHCSLETYREIGELARKYRTGVNIHMSQVKSQIDYTKKEFGLLPVELMSKARLLGKNVLFGHAIMINDKEIGLISRTGTSVCHVPASDMKLVQGVAPIPKYIERGVNVCLGCNGGPNNNTHDMIREMRLASYLHKITTMNPEVLPAETMLEIATVNGAKALMIENKTGSLEVGKAADMILIDLKEPQLHPVHNPASTLVYAASGADVSHVIVDGRVLMEDRQVKTLDEERIVREVYERIPTIIRKAHLTKEIGPVWPFR